MYVIRDKIKYRAKVHTKSQSENTGFTDGLPMFLADIACQAEEDAIADAFYMAELAAEAELDAIADAFYMAELAAEAELDAIADAMLLM